MREDEKFKSLAFRLSDQVAHLTQLVASMQLSINQLQAENQKMRVSNQVILSQPAPIRLFSSSPPLQEDLLMQYLSSSEEFSPIHDQKSSGFRPDVLLASSPPMMGYPQQQQKQEEDYAFMEMCDPQPAPSIDYTEDYDDNDRLQLISPLALQIPAEHNYSTPAQLPLTIPQQKSRKITRKISGPLKILIVEDDPLCQQLISHIIKSLHVGQCEVVADGVEAVINMSTGYFDLILMDMHLPHLDGLQATQNIRKFNRRTPIISMTARVGEEDVKRYFEGGIDEILPKPFDKQSVRRIIEQFYKLSIEE